MTVFFSRSEPVVVEEVSDPLDEPLRSEVVRLPFDCARQTVKTIAGPIQQNTFLTLERCRRQEWKAALPAAENFGVCGTVTGMGWRGSTTGGSNFGAGLA